MDNKPFRFLDSPGAIVLLRQALDRVGLTEQEVPDKAAVEANPYHAACLRFACPWLPKPIELHWHYAWWPDGTCSELARVSVVYEGTVCGEVDIEELLGQRLPWPLAELVADGIAACCAELTGKHVRSVDCQESQDVERRSGN